jgi:hypothetical protein
MKSILSVICSLVIMQCASAQSYDLKLNLKQGQKYDQSMSMNMLMDEAVAGQQVKINTKARFVFAQAVKGIDKDGNYQIESSYARMVIDVDAMGSKISYDSDKKVTDKTDTTTAEIAKSFSKVICKKYTVTLTPKGKVVKIEGLDEILAGMSENSNPVAQQIISSSFDAKKMGANYSSFYDYLPDHEVKKGDTWKHRNSIESVIPMDVEATYTLKEIKGNIATIGMNADLSMKDDSVEMQGMPAKIDLKGSYTGDYEMDIKTGLGKTAKINMPITGNMEIMGMSVPLDIKTEAEMSTTTK